MNKERIFEILEARARGYGFNRLSRDSGISRQGIYRLLTEKNPQFETFEKIASALQIDIGFIRNIPTTDHLYSSLRFYGAPISAKSVDPVLPLEETIGCGIALSRTDGFISSMIPYMLYKKTGELNSSHLIGICDNLGQSRALGYYADVANTFRPNKKLRLLADVLFDRDFSEQVFFTDSKAERLAYKKLAAMIDNPIAKKWKFQTIDGLSEQLERYRKWLRQE